MSFDLVREALPSLEPSLDYEGCLPFDLENIVNEYEPGLSLSFYSTYIDAFEAINALEDPKHYTTSQDVTIYVRAEGDNGCYSLQNKLLIQIL